MANEIMGKKLRFMLQDKFETITEADDELYAVNGSGIGFPSSRYEDLILGASGTEYTAPANGYFYLNKASGSTNQYIEFNNTDRAYSTILHAYASGASLRLLLPVQKDDVASLWYTASGTTNTFRFIYAEGE